MGDVEERITRIEAMIEDALWECVQNDDREKELAVYRQAKESLERMRDLPVEVQRERDRVLSYCLMRIDETLVNLGDENESEERAREALALAEKAGEEVQIARCRLALGIRLLSKSKLADAEDQWGQVIETAMDSENVDMQQVLGWTLIVRSHVLNGKSLYDQALVVAIEAEEILESIDNYAGVAAVNRILVTIHRNLGDSDSAERCKEKAEKFKGRAKTERK